MINAAFHLRNHLALIYEQHCFFNPVDAQSDRCMLPSKLRSTRNYRLCHETALVIQRVKLYAVRANSLLGE